MKTCAKCNLTYADDKKFCLKCGAPLTMIHQIEPKEVAKKNVFEDRLKSDPLNIEILHDYAQFLFNNLLFSDANTVSLKILAIKDNDGIAKELLFKSYFKLNLFKEASEIGKQLLSEKQTDIFLLQELAEISGKMGDSDKVTEYYDKILSLQPSHSAALYHKAQNLLAENQVEKAIEIFKKLHLGGQTDRITGIYVGIDKALNREYKTAIKLLSPILSDETSDTNDINTNRGVLYFAYCLSQSSIGLPEIKKWATKINLKKLKQNHHQPDEQTVVEIVEFIVSHSLNEINQSSNAKDKISELTKSYLGDGYFTKNSNSKLAEIWYLIGNKQVELKLFADAIISIQKAIDFNPDENKYKDKSAEIIKTLADVAKNQKKKALKLIAVFAVLILLIAVSTFTYKSYIENKAWELAISRNTNESLQKYLNLYPSGKFAKDAKHSLEKYVVTDIDGNKYHTVEIGTQGWMLENLKTTKYRNGDPIPQVTDPAIWANLRTGAWCYYNNDTTNGAIYGKLYNWYAVNDPRGLAPTAYHVPSDDEWTTLTTFLGDEAIAGGKLKEIGTTHWNSPNTSATNEVGFTALPSGYRYEQGLFKLVGDNCDWWSATEFTFGGKVHGARDRFVYYNYSKVGRNYGAKVSGYSVRCIRD